jgi:hypothetical protein
MGAKAVDLLMRGQGSCVIGHSKGEIKAVSYEELFKSEKEFLWDDYELARILAI